MGRNKLEFLIEEISPISRKSHVRGGGGDVVYLNMAVNITIGIELVFRNFFAHWDKPNGRLPCTSSRLL